MSKLDPATMRLGVHPGWAPPAFATRIAAAEPPPPAWSRILGTPRVAGDNTAVGDCVETGCFNATQTAMARAGSLAPKLPDDAVLALYERLTGYVPGNQATDNGTDPNVMFAWWQANDIHRHRLKMAEPMDPQDLAAIRRAIVGTGGAAVVLNLSVENQNQPILLPEGQPGSWGRHFVWLDSYEARVFSGTSWGAPFYLDESYFAASFVLAAYELVLAPA